MHLASLSCSATTVNIGIKKVSLFTDNIGEAILNSYSWWLTSESIGSLIASVSGSIPWASLAGTSGLLWRLTTPFFLCFPSAEQEPAMVEYRAVLASPIRWRMRNWRRWDERSLLPMGLCWFLRQCWHLKQHFHRHWGVQKVEPVEMR